MKIILLPQWVQRALEFNNLPLTEASNLEKLSTILSPNDVGYYAYINTITSEFLGTNSLALLNNGWDLPSEEWADRVRAKMVSFDQRQGQNTIEALFGRYADEESTYSFTSEILANDTIIIIPVEQPNTISSKEREVLRYTFYDRLIGQLLTIHSMEYLTGCEIFKDYLKVTHNC